MEKVYVRALNKNNHQNSYLCDGENVYRIGDVVKAKINGKYDTEAVFHMKSNGVMALVQNDVAGSNENIILKYYPDYKHSWSFGIRATQDRLDSGVEILSKTGKRVKIDLPEIYMECTGSIYRIKKNGTEFIRFRANEYPSCCGSIIFNGFGISNSSVIDKLTDKDMSQILEAITDKFIRKQGYSNITCIIPNSEKIKLKIIKGIGFKEFNSFLNKNSGRILKMFNYNDPKQDRNDKK